MDQLAIDEVDEIRLAGAFGSQIDPTHAMILGLIPDCDLAHVRSAGNAAGTGALIALLSGAARTEIEGVVRRVEKIETAVEPRFQQHFVEAMAFPHKTAAVPAPRPRSWPCRNAAPTTGAAAAHDARNERRRRRTRGDRHEGGRLMDDPQRRRSGGRAARQALRLAAHAEHVPFLTRTLAPFEVLGEEGLVAHRAQRRHDPRGGRRRVPRRRRGAPAPRATPAPTSTACGSASRAGCAGQIVQATAPRQFTQYARNPERNVEIGGMHTVFAPNYGSPFVRDLDGGRRYGTIEDFRNLVKLTYASPYLHHSGGTVCEPVDVPVNKRHLDMVYSHIRYSDKPFMGSVTAPERARDTVEMARLTFGADYLEDHTVIPR